MSIGILAITEDGLLTLLRCAVAFREILVDSACGEEGCENCGKNLDVIEQITEAIIPLELALGVEAAFIRPDPDHPDKAAIAINTTTKH
jgi:hypothetical protein